MITAGLTGGIASGKTTVAGMFARLGARVIDADAVAHEILLRDEIVSAVTARFGRSVLDDHGRVDRKRLGGAVFADSAHRAWLNRLMHPPVRAEIQRRLDAPSDGGAPPLTIVDVPLLVESGEPRRYGPLILAFCPEEIQVERLMRRDALNRSAALQRIRAQRPIDEKRAMADFIIDTSGPLADTFRQVQAVRRQLLEEAAAR
ncbi:MAG TPA: dephospho-CoA kinase [Acidobacteriota bacterium]|nr:dephospho-CoA kinase [Acidobacteriota bacterium]